MPIGLSDEITGLAALKHLNYMDFSGEPCRIRTCDPLIKSLITSFSIVLWAVRLSSIFLLIVEVFAY